MRTLALIPALGLCACASTQAVMNQPTDQSFTSDKPVNVVAFCIASKNEDVAQDGPNGGKVVRLTNMFGAVIIIYEIMPQGEGSVVTLRKANSPGTFTRFKDCL